MRFLQRQQMIIIVLTAALMSGFAMFLYYPLSRQTRAVKQADAAQTSSAAKADARRKQLPLLRKQTGKLERRLQNFDQKLPTGREFAGLWQQIADVMNEHKLKDQLVQPGSEIQSPHLNCIPISIRCSGTDEQIFEFLKSIEKLERLIRIEKFSLENDRDFTGWLKMNAEAYVYYRSSEPDKT
ncbi:MAG TPA: type 4a pilus biogenesis protein PilO [Planctomycetes bacterium]|nr:type 4a pilus biogenesis protein PilO [Planctomycetota bacterium]